MGDFPLYDRANVPESECPGCAGLRAELRLAQRKNQNLRAEVRFLNGIPPKGTNHHIEHLRQEVRVLRAELVKAQQLLDFQRAATKRAKQNALRMHGEREALKRAIEGREP